MEYQIAVNKNQTHMINTDKSQKHRASQKRTGTAQHTHVCIQVNTCKPILFTAVHRI